MHNSLFRNYSSIDKIPPLLNICYVEAGIAALHYFGLRSAVFVCHYPLSKTENWEISAIENSNFLGIPHIVSHKSSDVILVNLIIEVMKKSAQNLSNNVIVAVDATPTDPNPRQGEPWYRSFLSGMSEEQLLSQQQQLKILSSALVKKNPNINIWEIKSHKNLVKGAMNFSTMQNFNKLPKHIVYGW